MNICGVKKEKLHDSLKQGMPRDCGTADSPFTPVALKASQVLESHQLLCPAPEANMSIHGLQKVSNQTIQSDAHSVRNSSGHATNRLIAVHYTCAPSYLVRRIHNRTVLVSVLYVYCSAGAAARALSYSHPACSLPVPLAPPPSPPLSGLQRLQKLPRD